MRTYLLAAVLLVSLNACVLDFGKRVKGDGHVVTQNRQPAAFSRVEQRGSFDVVLQSGANHEVRIEAEENIAEHIETDTEGGVLVIRTRKGFNLQPTKDIRITVIAPGYKGIQSNGSGNISGSGMLRGDGSLEVSTRGSGDINIQVTVPELKAESMGSGNITLSGQSNHTELSTTGSGNLVAENLEAEKVSVDIRGSGNASVNASKELEIDIKGSGDVSYRGNPAIRTDIKGSGNLRKID
ncbi:head GIN domain-containing protein [Flavihumibacter petaseus]|uniref:Putative auto-transporter adhesin head GIN domain-containing protein n=1 Tax=Flavihumibacter petaseus NBRC 106054 TaxID=1220578 RepID=A0A0E9MUS2_9BACT|nr:head GIN domain-containing protein [Flavihumibacter petaseus]GAO41243.1 hypothetical protein FPE01S_01_02550 [Flavihumibacter petaseus NBRC 106054]